MCLSIKVQYSYETLSTMCVEEKGIRTFYYQIIIYLKVYLFGRDIFYTSKIGCIFKIYLRLYSTHEVITIMRSTNIFAYKMACKTRICVNKWLLYVKFLSLLFISY